jgi:mono/diheme cytochrome c family protein
MRKFLGGFFVAYLLFAAVVYEAIQNGWIPAAADQAPGLVERWAAKESLRAAIRRESHGLTSPLPVNDENLVKGARIYLTNCLVCHGAADGKPSAIARGLNIPPPQFAFDGVDDDPAGETYWKVKHGIRFTGMPAYGGSLSEDEMWQVTLFVGHLSHPSQASAATWNAMPSAAMVPQH